MADSTQDLSWMEKFVYPGDIRPGLSSPFSMSAAGSEWVVATNGKMLVAVKGVREGVAHCPNSYVEEATSGFLGLAPKDSVYVPFEELKAFAGQPHWPSEEPCSKCNGEGMSSCSNCRGTGEVEVECEHCLESHDCVCQDCDEGEVKCLECDGTGKAMGKAPIRPGVICGVLFNLEDISRVFSFLCSERILVGVDNKNKLVIRSGSWTLISMMVNIQGQHPEFKVEAAQVAE